MEGGVLEGRAEPRLANPARICAAGEGKLRLRFGEKFDQVLPRFFGMTVKLQEFLIMADRQLEDPWIFHHDLRSPLGRFGEKRADTPFAAKGRTAESPYRVPAAVSWRLAPTERARRRMPGATTLSHLSGSTPISPRKAARPRDSRERTVPTGIPSIVPISL